MKAGRRYLIVGMLVLVSVIAILVLNRQTTHSVQIGIIEPMVNSAISDITRGIRDGLGVDNNSEVIVHINNANGDATMNSPLGTPFKYSTRLSYIPLGKSNIANGIVVC